MSDRPRSKKRWVLVVDVLAVALLIAAFYVLVVATPIIIFSVFGEFGPTPCDCEDLEAELETVDWLGTGEGIRFKTPGVVDEHFQERGLEVEASRLMAGDSSEEAEILIDRLSDQPGTVEVAEMRGEEPNWTAFRHGQVLISVGFNGRLIVNGPEDIAALTGEIQDLGETMGRVPRPAARLGERLGSDVLLFRGFGLAVVTFFVVYVWFLARLGGAISRSNSRQPLETPGTIEEDQ